MKIDVALTGDHKSLKTFINAGLAALAYGQVGITPASGDDINKLVEVMTSGEDDE